MRANSRDRIPETTATNHDPGGGEWLNSAIPATKQNRTPRELPIGGSFRLLNQPLRSVERISLDYLFGDLAVRG